MSYRAQFSRQEEPGREAPKGVQGALPPRAEVLGELRPPRAAGRFGRPQAPQGRDLLPTGGGGATLLTKK